jgi:hypothetical protein
MTTTLQVIIKEPKNRAQRAEFVEQGLRHVAHRIHPGPDSEIAQGTASATKASGAPVAGVMIDATKMPDNSPLNNLRRGRRSCPSFEKRTEG